MSANASAPASAINSKIGILTGPTATGKTALAIEAAKRFPGIEILNADSLLIFRGMDIGTAKPTREERAGVPHHLIDIRDPSEPFTAGDFRREALAAIDGIHARGKRALVVGGTGFYLKALLFGLWDSPGSDPALRRELERVSSPELYQELFREDEKAALRIGAHDRYRLVRAIEILRLSGKTPSELERAQADREPDPRFATWIIDRPSTELFPRIRLRSEEMIRAGLLEETRALMERHPGARPLGSVGYAQAVAYLQAKAPLGRKIRPGLEGLLDEIDLATRQLVKRQRTWFKSQKHAEFFLLDRDRDALIERISTLYS